METDRQQEVDKPEPTPVDNFRAMIGKVNESYNAPDVKAARKARREARKFGADVVEAFVNSSKLEQRDLRAKIEIIMLQRGDMVRDIYYTLLRTKKAPAVVVRDLLYIRPHGPLPKGYNMAQG